MTHLIKIPRKRRRKNKTDYKSRFSLLKSSAKRIVVRRTNRYVLLQLVETIEAQDKILRGISSKQLIENGWDAKLSGSLKSIPACYLTGMSFAKLLDKKERYIVDLGMARNVKGSRLFAVINGLIDGGVEIKVKKESLPPQEKLEGKHTKKGIDALIKKIKAKLGPGVKDEQRK